MNQRDPDDLETGNKIGAIFVNHAGNLERLHSIIEDTKTNKTIARKIDKGSLMIHAAFTVGGCSGRLGELP